MRRFLIITLTSILFTGFKSKAQNVVFDWVYTISDMSGWGPENVQKLDYDSNGNIYVFGTFYGTVQFDPIYFSGTATSNGSQDCFILKLSPERNFIWLKTFGGPSVDRIADGFLFDDQHLYITGLYNQTMDIDPGVGVYNISTVDPYGDKIFVLKLDTAGNFVWAKDFGSEYNTDTYTSVTADSIENIYIGGGFQDTVDFDPGPGVTELISNGDFDAFVQKLDANGNFIWVKQFGSIDKEIVKDVSTDVNGNIYSSGHFEETGDFDPGVSSYPLTSVGAVDGFVQKLDKNGEFIFANSYGGVGNERMNDMVIKDEFIYTTGMFFETVDFDGSANVYNVTSAGVGDVFVHKQDTNGTFYWVKTIGASSLDESYAIDVDAAHNIYTCGRFSYDTDFDPGPSVELITSNSSNEQYVHKLDSTGGFGWVYPFVNSVGSHIAFDIVVDDSQNVIIGGQLGSALDFDLGPGTSYGVGDAFIYKLKQCYISTGTDVVQVCDNYTWLDGVTYSSSTNSPVFILENTEGCDSIVSLDLTILESTFNTQSITSCDEYTWIDGNTYTNSNNSATYVLTNSNGCDSVISLNLTINGSSSGTDQIVMCEPYTWIDGNTYSSNNNTATYTLSTVEGCDSLITLDLIINYISDLTISSQDTILIANNTGAHYQWLRCDNNMLPIWNATDDTLFVMENGDYAVAIAENGCVDTSDCVIVSTLSLSESEHVNKFKYYPNPTNDKIYIEMDEPCSVNVYDITGRTIKTPQATGKKLTVDLSEQKPGVYIFHLHFNNRTERFKVVLK